MEISWLGHSSLRIQSRTTTLITDPYADSLGISMGSQAADIVTISNPHPHHSNIEAIEGSPRVLSGPGEYEISDLYITGIGTRFGDFEGDRQINTIFTIRAEGLVVCHLGDLTQRLTPGQLEELNQTDILIAPGGGFCTVDASAIAQLIGVISPRIVIPVHYKTDEIDLELEPLDRLLSELGVTEVSPQRNLNITSTNLPAALQVVALQRAR